MFQAYPPDGEIKLWWDRLKKALGTACLISDIQMPGLSGVELRSLLVARGCKTPIIFVTACIEAETCAKATNAGAIGFLPKPFDTDRLIEFIHVALGDREIEPSIGH
jgi:FixJ family two-component response regulator